MYMLIISEKRIKIILSLILISVFTFACSNVKNENNNENKTVETTATPVSGKTVILDARPSEFLMKEQKAKMV